MKLNQSDSISEAFSPSLYQNVSTLTLLTFCTVYFAVRAVVYRTMLSSTPGLQLLDASSITPPRPQAVTIKISSDTAKCPLGGQNYSLPLHTKNHCSILYCHCTKKAKDNYVHGYRSKVKRIVPEIQGLILSLIKWILPRV